MPKLRFQWNSVPKLILRAKVHRLVPNLFRAEVTRAEHRLPLPVLIGTGIVQAGTLDSETGTVLQFLFQIAPGTERFFCLSTGIE